MHARLIQIFDFNSEALAWFPEEGLKSKILKSSMRLLAAHRKLENYGFPKAGRAVCAFLAAHRGQ